MEINFTVSRGEGKEEEGFKKRNLNGIIDHIKKKRKY